MFVSGFAMEVAAAEHRRRRLAEAERARLHAQLGPTPDPPLAGVRARMARLRGWRLCRPWVMPGTGPCPPPSRPCHAGGSPPAAPMVG